MRALCLITVNPGKVDFVVEILKKKRKIVKQIMVVDFKKIKDIVTTETLIEVEVNMGW
jgi:hypothetical protein